MIHPDIDVTIKQASQHPAFLSEQELLQIIVEFAEIMGSQSKNLIVPPAMAELYEIGARYVLCDDEDRGHVNDIPTLDDHTQTNSGKRELVLCPWNERVQGLYNAMNVYTLALHHKNKRLSNRSLQNNHIRRSIDDDTARPTSLDHAYQVDKLRGLLKFLRNFIQHNAQYPRQCEEIFKRADPSAQQIMEEFINPQFGPFFTHTLCFVAIRFRDYLASKGSPQRLSVVSEAIKPFAQVYYEQLRHRRFIDDEEYERIVAAAVVNDVESVDDDDMEPHEVQSEPFTVVYLRVPSRSSASSTDVSITSGASKKAVRNNVYHHDWFLANIKKQDSILLLSNKSPGSFHVALGESNKRDFTLYVQSGRGEEEVVGLQIRKENGFFHFGEPKVPHSFQQISELIQHYTEAELMVNNHGRSVKLLKL